MKYTTNLTMKNNNKQIYGSLNETFKMSSFIGLDLISRYFFKTGRLGATAQRPLGTPARAKRGSVSVVNKEKT